MEKQFTEILSEYTRELDKTPVISDEFKEWLLSQALTAVKAAHKKGYSAGISDAQKSSRKR